jgi:hypothetical protein
MRLGAALALLTLLYGFGMCGSGAAQIHLPQAEQIEVVDPERRIQHVDRSP